MVSTKNQGREAAGKTKGSKISVKAGSIVQKVAVGNKGVGSKNPILEKTATTNSQALNKMILEACQRSLQLLPRSLLAVVLADAPTLHLPKSLPTETTSVSATTRPTPRRRSSSSAQGPPSPSSLRFGEE